MNAAVLDCMVYLQAATNDRGPAFACLALVETGEVTLYVSAAILAEVRDVLTRPKIRASTNTTMASTKRWRFVQIHAPGSVIGFRSTF